MQTLPSSRLGDVLLMAAVITQNQLDWALEQQKVSYRRLGEILLENNLVSEADIVQAHALQLDIPFIDLEDVVVSSEVVQTIPEAIARAYVVYPVSLSSERLVVAMANPMDIEAIDAIARATHKRIEPLLAGASQITSRIDHTFSELDPVDVSESLEDTIGDIAIEAATEEAEEQNINEEKRLSDQAPVVKAVNMVLQEAVRGHASDIHFEPRSTSLEIRFRVDGVLQHVRTIPRRLQAAMVSRIKIMASMDISEKRKPQDGRISAKILGRSVDMRISTLSVQHGERLVIRLLDKQAPLRSLDQLGLRTDEQRTFEALIKKPHGIILVTGPTGSGKTTTLYSALAHIKSPETNIMTCEDPIEYEIDGINQSAVLSKAGISFASSLRAMLRQDPDVILIGEIRDKETVEVAVQAAMTGHLVFSTLHCNDAPSAITRMIDMGIEPFMISSVIVGVVAQRLVRLLCPQCKAPFTPSVADIAMLGENVDISGADFRKPVGCSSCNMRGYIGRIPIFELMTMNEDLRLLTSKRPTSEELMNVATSHGMRTLLSHTAEKVVQGLTSFDEFKKKVFTSEEIT